MARRESDYSRPTVRRRGMRTGYTTGACAAAAAKAATLALLTGDAVSEVTIRLPIGEDATFQIHRCEINSKDGVLDGDGNPITTKTATCSVIKDGGDDPDVTSGAEICAKVWLKHDIADYLNAAAAASAAASEYEHCAALASYVSDNASVEYADANWDAFTANECYVTATESTDVVIVAQMAHESIRLAAAADDQAEEAAGEASAFLTDLDEDEDSLTFDRFVDADAAEGYFTNPESADATIHAAYERGDEAFWEAAEVVGNPFRGSNFGVYLRGGEGVGTVTKPGTGIDVGDASITRVPRRMITEAVADATNDADDKHLESEDYSWDSHFTDFEFIVEISVPGGAEIAKKTDNPRLGIVGGISILGTTGVVQPFSTAAWRASVNVSIDVAAANNLKHMAITTGTQSENFARQWLGLEDMAYVNVGIFTGAALKRCAQRGIPRATLVGMIGKFSKIAQGYFVTHVAGNKVDPVFLASLAAECGASEDVQAEMRDAASGRHFQEIALEHGVMSVFDLVCERVCAEAHRYLGDRADALIVDAICFDFEGGILGKATTSSRPIPLIEAAASDD